MLCGHVIDKLGSNPRGPRNEASAHEKGHTDAHRGDRLPQECGPETPPCGMLQGL